MELHEVIKKITPPDGAARDEAQLRWDACAKPLGSLGLLETAIFPLAFPYCRSAYAVVSALSSVASVSR